MSGLAVGIAAAGMGASYLNNQAKKKQETANQMANAAAIQYSPWTGMKTSMQGKDTGSDIAAAMQGGIGGAMMGANIKKSLQEPTPVPEAPVKPQVGVDYQLPAAQVGAVPGNPWDQMLQPPQKKSFYPTA